MRFFKNLLFIATLALVLAVGYVSALPEPEGLTVKPRDAAPIPVELDKRQCTGTCSCQTGTRQGQYCGSCIEVISCGGGSCFDDVFECNPRGGCCSYGRRTSCVESNLPCGP